MTLRELTDPHVLIEPGGKLFATGFAGHYACIVFADAKAAQDFIDGGRLTDWKAVPICKAFTEALAS